MNYKHLHAFNFVLTVRHLSQGEIFTRGTQQKPENNQGTRVHIVKYAGAFHRSTSP